MFLDILRYMLNVTLRTFLYLIYYSNKSLSQCTVLHYPSCCVHLFMFLHHSKLKEAELFSIYCFYDQ